MNAGKAVLLLAAAVSILTALHWAWDRGRLGFTDDPPQTVNPANQEPSPARTIERMPALSAALPPADARVPAVFAELQQRADQGDAHAACRLAVSLLDCRALDSWPQPVDPDEEERMLERAHGAAAANFAAQLRLGMIAARQRCAGVTDAQKALAPHYLRQAARAGVNEALVRYADGATFPQDGPFRVLRDPAFDLWRSEAPAMMQRALHQGEPAAVAILWMAYTSDTSFFTGLVPDDRVRGAAFRLLMSRLSGKGSRPLENLTSDEIRRAREEAARMHRDFFGNEVIAADGSLQAALRPPWMNGEDATLRASCL